MRAKNNKIKIEGTMKKVWLFGKNSSKSGKIL